MCCLLEFLKATITHLGMLVGLVVLMVALLLTVKLTYTTIFPKRRRAPYSYQEQWFGKAPGPPTDAGNLDTSIKPFKIDVSDEVLEDLKRRLQNTRFEDPVEDSKFHYGFNPNYLRKVVDYWLKEYDWRKQEKMLNQYPHFKTNLEGIDVHFIHVKPDLPPNSKVRVLPLLIIHGWPGSVVEFYKIIPLLTTPRPNHDFVFEVICPSIPGYGFSESPHRKGFNIHSAARMFVTLMERIGHSKFYIQGGDWGSAICQILARYHSPRILGLHVNMYFSALRTWEKMKLLVINFFPFLVTKAESDMMLTFSKFLKIFWEEGGYFHIQSTKPDTVGCAMVDSPAGMAAYLLEKFAYWVNPKSLDLEDGGLTQKFTMDELLTNVMLYWINNNFAAAARMYKENATEIVQGKQESSTVTIPSAVAVFPNELMMLPKTCLSQQMPNLISYNIMPRGGHFAAFEEPQLLADDIWQFVRKVEK